LVSAGLLLVVQAPIGAVPLGYALVIALGELLSRTDYVVVMGTAVLVSIPVLVQRYGQADGFRRALRWSVAATAAGLMAWAAGAVLSSHSEDATLARVIAVGFAF